MGVPKNQILENQYTRGGEFYTSSDGKNYQGYYCIILSTKFFTGKTYDSTSKPLTKRTETPSTSNPTSLPKQNSPTRFFIRKVNVQPIIIKEVDENTYESLQNNPIYQTTYVGVYNGNNQTPDQAEKQMPGIKTFLLG
jgi:hypothetical protein